ncbi:MAG: hypothetical protein Q8L81_13710 [Bacteroidota bacterium]|nr:hypothetical protein [Bacteroidota bacterium]
MKMIRKYISLLMLVSLLFPIVEKALHDIEHFNDDSCEIKHIHFCKAEHICFICDYVFSSSSNPPVASNRVIVFGQLSIILILIIAFNTIISQKFTFTLRGPPVC